MASATPKTARKAASKRGRAGGQRSSTKLASTQQEAVATSFPFGRLPLELRQMCWEAALPDMETAQMHQLSRYDLHANTGDYFCRRKDHKNRPGCAQSENLTKYMGQPFSFCGMAWVPSLESEALHTQLALAHVSPDSRETLKRWQRRMEARIADPDEYQICSMNLKNPYGKDGRGFPSILRAYWNPTKDMVHVLGQTIRSSNFLSRARGGCSALGHPSPEQKAHAGPDAFRTRIAVDVATVDQLWTNGNFAEDSSEPHYNSNRRLRRRILTQSRSSVVSAPATRFIERLGVDLTIYLIEPATRRRRAHPSPPLPRPSQLSSSSSTLAEAVEEEEEEELRATWTTANRRFSEVHPCDKDFAGYGRAKNAVANNLAVWLMHYWSIAPSSWFEILAVEPRDPAEAREAGKAARRAAALATKTKKKRALKPDNNDGEDAIPDGGSPSKKQKSGDALDSTTNTPSA